MAIDLFAGLPGMIPGAADRNLLSQAYRASEDLLVERAMLEDKIKATGILIFYFRDYLVLFKWKEYFLIITKWKLFLRSRGCFIDKMKWSF